MGRKSLLSCGVSFAALVSGAAELPGKGNLGAESLTALVAQHFGGARPADARGSRFPSHFIADFNLDGSLDLVVTYVDAETEKRGEGCYGIGIVTSYDTEASRVSFQAYDCFKEYSVDTRSIIQIRTGGGYMYRRLNPPRPCVRIILKYDGRNFVCFDSGRYQTIATTPR